jgi:hypothetical protein
VPDLSSPDATIGIACALPVLEMADHLDTLQDLVADALDEVRRHDRRLRIAIEPYRAEDLYAQTVAWARARKACCPYLGFAVEETPAAVVLEIAVPVGAELMLDGFETLVRTAGRVAAAA